MSISTRLWQESGDLAAVALSHRFVRGLADGSLPRESFAAYVAQDAYFLETFARAYALALARSPDRVSLEAFADLLGGVMNELQLHSSYAYELGIDLTATEPSWASTSRPPSRARPPWPTPTSCSPRQHSGASGSPAQR